MSKNASGIFMSLNFGAIFRSILLSAAFLGFSPGLAFSQYGGGSPYAFQGVTGPQVSEKSLAYCEDVYKKNRFAEVSAAAKQLLIHNCAITEDKKQ